LYCLTQNESQDIKKKLVAQLIHAGFRLTKEGEVVPHSLHNPNAIPLPLVLDKMAEDRPLTVRVEHHDDDAVMNLSEEQTSQYDLPIKVFGIETVHNILNVHWNNRKIGLEEVHKLSSNSSAEEVCKATCQILDLTLEDTREQCAKLSMGILENLIEYSNDNQISNVLFHCTQPNLLSHILLKTADMNARVQKVSKFNSVRHSDD
jgi:hypothetical protein